MNENDCIITSLNLYEFSQVNNNEMGILITRQEDKSVYQDAYDEAQRIIRIGNIIHTPQKTTPPKIAATIDKTPPKKEYTQTLTTTKLAEKLGLSSDELNRRLCEVGFQELKGSKYFLTEEGKYVGGLLRKRQYGYFIVCPDELSV